jgi:dihydropteroate synthase
VRALQEERALEAAKDAGVPICLMHMQGQPTKMQQNPVYDDVVQDELSFFKLRIGACAKAGIKLDQLIVDPGFGFGKTMQHNYQLLANLEHLQSLGLPLMVGMSRKSMLGSLLGRDIQDRLAGSLTTAIVAMQKGVKILRVHDVKETVDAVKVINAVNAFRSNNER